MNVTKIEQGFKGRKPGMNSRSKIMVIRDVSCTSSRPYDSEHRGSEPNPLDFGGLMEKIRETMGSFFLSFFLLFFFYPILVIPVLLSGRSL